MINEIDLYVESKKFDWSGETPRTERRRLVAVGQYLTGDAPHLWSSIQHMKPYSRLTLWIRVSDFWNWRIKEGRTANINPYADFKNQHPKLFRNVYEKSKPDITYEEARGRISLIKNPQVRSKALQILDGGLRFSESLTVEGGRVRGKGGKVRDAYVLPIDGFNLSYRTFHRILVEETNLKPHDLRKIFASNLAAAGAGEFDLLEIMGWSDLETARSYIQVSKSRARELVNRVQGKDTKCKKANTSRHLKPS